MRREFYFAYGSNMDQQQMRQRCPDFRREFVAKIENSCLCFPRSSPTWKGGVASIQKHASKTVWGVVYALSTRDLCLLDCSEGFRVKRPLKDKRNSYYRSKIKVTDTKGREHKVWTYFAIPVKAKSPSVNYRDQLVRGAEQHIDLGMPRAYITALRSIKAKGEQ